MDADGSPEPTYDALRKALVKAIKSKRETRYHTAKCAEIDRKTLDRFLDEESNIRLSTVEHLAEWLGLELRPKAK
jgi:DNA-binding phage protein